MDLIRIGSIAGYKKISNVTFPLGGFAIIGTLYEYVGKNLSIDTHTIKK